MKNFGDFYYLLFKQMSQSISSSEPYEKIIEKNAYFKAQRIAENTKNEISDVLKRVENVYIFKIKL